MVMRGEVGDDVPGFYNSIKKARPEKLRLHSKQVLVRG